MRYEVLTYDAERATFTPQDGVRKGPYSKWGVKRALRKLQQIGYECHRQDHSVLVQQVQPKAKRIPKPPAAARKE